MAASSNGSQRTYGAGRGRSSAERRLLASCERGSHPALPSSDVHDRCISEPTAGFDPEKRIQTIKDRRLDFLDAIALFDGRPMLTARSDRNDEERYKTVTIGN